LFLPLIGFLASIGSGQPQEGPADLLTARYDFQRPAARFALPGRLDEVSGLAVSGGLLYAHDDERGIVYRVDPATGSVDGGFGVGAPPRRADFEGITRAGDRWFLVTSRAYLYEFREAAEGSSTPVRVTDTGLGGSCEVEGLAFHQAANSLLLACKVVAPPARSAVVHWLPLDPQAPSRAPIRVAFRSLVPFGLEDGIYPSGIDVDPVTGSLVLVSARERALVEVDLAGRVLSAVALPRRRHAQPEGVTFGPRGRLFVADEASGGTARVTAYRLRGGGS
jgi:hypothetical protein